jgi:hypothetical protein
MVVLGERLGDVMSVECRWWVWVLGNGGVGSVCVPYLAAVVVVVMNGRERGTQWTSQPVARGRRETTWTKKKQRQASG